jgi:hypothetical protein
MPKTAEQRHALLDAIHGTLTEGYMSTTFPENTIWLGARWSPVDKQWRWDDGTILNQPTGEPGSENSQEQEPWLCMAQNGRVRGIDSPHSFGVFCEHAPNAIGDVTAPVSSVSFWKAGHVTASAADMVKASKVHMGGDGGGSSEVRVFQATSGAKDASVAGKMKGRKPSKSATGMMKDTGAATDMDSWNGLGVVQKFGIPTAVKAPTVRLVKLLHLDGLAVSSAAVVLLVAGLSLSLLRVQRFRSGSCSRAASCSVSAGHNMSSAYAQLREALQERFEAGEVGGTQADTA